MTSVPARLSLYDVQDVEKLCREVLERRLGEWGAYLRPELYEDALAYLVATAWELSLTYDPKASDLAFSTYSYRLLRRRLVDWYRSTFGDSRHAPRPELLSLDVAAAESGPSLVESLPDAEDWVGRILEAESARLPLEELSAEASWTLDNVARPLAAGSSSEDVARRLGKSRRHLNRHLEELRLELLDLYPELAA